MDTSSASASGAARREFERLNVHARAKIRIGKRAYAGFIENISQGGARIVTVTSIREIAPVSVIVPDLPPMSGTLRWVNGSEAGVQFHLKLNADVLSEWLGRRMRRAA
jgi:hypothetical protein